MTEYIEGKRPVLEALRTDIPVQRVLIAKHTTPDGLIEDVLRKARARNIPVQEVARAYLDRISARGSHQGIAAEAKPFAYASLADVLQRAARQAELSGGSALIVVLDHITDAGNFGAIARSAEIVGAAGIVIANKRSAYVMASTYKSSAGAIAHIPVAQVANIKAALTRCKEEGFWVAGASEKAEGTLWEAPLTGKLALVMGNEEEGLARITQEACDFFIALPQLGKTASLNVAQSATACMYEWLRQNQNVLAAQGFSDCAKNARGDCETSKTDMSSKRPHTTTERSSRVQKTSRAHAKKTSTTRRKKA